MLSLSFGLVGCSDPRGESQIQMNKLQLALYEYAQSHENEWPDSLNQIKELVGGESAFKQLITNPVTGDNPGYEYVKPLGNPSDPDYNPHQLILYQLNNGQRDTTLKSGYSDGAFE
jgi:hypothetical protein